MSEKSERVKDKVRDSVERSFDKLHEIADVVTAPIAPIDGVIHGTARGVLNLLTDKHPQKVECPNKGNREECHEGGGGPTPPPAGNHNNSGTQTQNWSGTNNGFQSGSTGNISGINFNK